tara:strand:+ start:525 stop:1355 length:831 start_codon:yes stop_codon:yes gene_type:complete
MELKLYIYSGLGNIIALVDLLREEFSFNSRDIVKILEVEGVNFDQLISILPPESPDVDLAVEIYNKDGSIAKNCINGARCLTKFVQDEGLIANKELLVNTLGGLWHLKAHKNGDYSVKFTNPDNQEIKDNLPPENSKNKHVIPFKDQEIRLGVIDLGNPHAVIFEELNKETSLEKIGKALQGSDWFPEGVNLGIGKIVSNNEIDLRVFERGAGITLACGSGACAAALIAIEDNAIETPVKVNFEKGSIFIDYNTEGKQITARGKAEFIKEMSVTIQ